VLTPFREKDNSFQNPIQPTETKMEGKQEVEIIRSWGDFLQFCRNYIEKL